MANVAVLPWKYSSSSSSVVVDDDRCVKESACVSDLVSNCCEKKITKMNEQVTSRVTNPKV